MNPIFKTRLIIQNQNGKIAIIFQLKWVNPNKTGFMINNTGTSYWVIESNGYSSGKVYFDLDWKCNKWTTIGIWVPEHEIDINNVNAFCYTDLPRVCEKLTAKIGDA